MIRPLGVVRGGVAAMRERRRALTCQSERTLMLGAILLVSAVSVGTGYILVQCASVDVLSSLLWIPQDCWLDWGMNIGRHCFGDYAMVVGAGMQPNPWAYQQFLPPDYQPVQLEYPAAGWLPHMLFALPAKWLGVPRLGLISYLLALTVAVFSPALWAARGTRGLERVVVFVALGVAAVPAWAVIDRGNSAGFVVPIALVFLVALRRERWGVVALMVVLAAMVKPQFAALVVALLAARQWRWGGAAVVGVVVANLAAYLLWPRDFPQTISQSIHNLSHFATSFGGLTDVKNVSFGRALLLIPDAVKGAQTGGKLPEGYLAGPRSVIGYALLILVVLCVLALGRRIPPVMAGIVLLATATLSPSVAMLYYLIFVLPVAALVVRDPNGPPVTGLFDRLALHGDGRRTVGIWVSLAVALSIAQVAIPGQPVPIPIWGQWGARGVIGTTQIVLTTVPLTPILWLIACVVIVVSYTRKPAPAVDDTRQPTRRDLPDTDGGTSSSTFELMTQSEQSSA
ncbi:glycosyltransferase 87 family protein [Mycobacterium sp. E2479]|uniref:glycosyltransferase 87 family protein n=1 Tax=Mycobacterium sp. E2479 TaxID=1834134 RepID=UPI0009ED3B35|nr:glycosyltransferase 87 family protein [Mycobacterium sp. E2479]